MIIPSTPISAFIQLTPDCNNSCPGCSNKFTDLVGTRRLLPSPLSINDWKLVFRKLKPSVTRLRITGGEATLFPELNEVFNCLADQNIPFSLFTNARWSAPDYLISLLKHNPYYKGMLVSLHGSTANEHDTFSNVSGSFDETVENIKRTTNAGMGVHTNTVLTKLNFDKIDQVYQFARSLGVSQVIIARYIGKTIPEIELTPEQLRFAVETIEKLRTHGAKIKHSGCIPQCFASSGAYGCTAAITFLTIDPWGNVCPCNHVAYYCGNLLEQSLEQIWYSDKMNSWREEIPIKCRGCAEFGNCHGGCHAAAIAYESTQDPLMIEPLRHSPNLTKKPLQIRIYKDGRPKMACLIRPEPFGYLLIRDVQTIPVSIEAKAVLEACDGTVTMGNIEERFGEDGVNFVGIMIHRGFAKLVQN